MLPRKLAGRRVGWILKGKLEAGRIGWKQLLCEVGWLLRHSSGWRKRAGLRDV